MSRLATVTHEDVERLARPMVRGPGEPLLEAPREVCGSAGSGKGAEINPRHWAASGPGLSRFRALWNRDGPRPPGGRRGFTHNQRRREINLQSFHPLMVEQP